MLFVLISFYCFLFFVFNDFYHLLNLRVLMPFCKKYRISIKGICFTISWIDSEKNNNCSAKNAFIRENHKIVQTGLLGAVTRSCSMRSVAAFACFAWAKHSGLYIQKIQYQCLRLQLLRAFVWAKPSGLDVRFCENQGVRLQLLRVLYWPSRFLGQLRNCYFFIKSTCSVAAFACFVLAKHSGLRI